MLTWYATNNSATVDDMDVLGALGVEVLSPSAQPVEVYRDPMTGRVLARVGTVTVHEDGRVTIRPRSDAPRVATTVLLRTASECISRDLHRRDEWAHTPANGDRPGYWRARISMQLPTGTSLFAEHHAVLTLPLGTAAEQATRTPVREHA